MAGQFGEFPVAVQQFVFADVPEAEFADAGGVDQFAAGGQVEQAGSDGGVLTQPGGGGQIAHIQSRFRKHRIHQG